MRRAIVLLFGVLLPLMVYATIYKQVDENGSVTYSDLPSKGATEFELPEVTNYKAEPANADGGLEDLQEMPVDEPYFTGYQSIQLKVPNEQLRAGEVEQQKVLITVTLKPALQAGHRVELHMDGQKVGESKDKGKTQIYFELNLAKVYGGDHEWQAVVFSKRGKKPLISSDKQKMTVIQPKLPSNSPLRYPKTPASE